MCSTQREYGTVPGTLSQQGSPGQTLAQPGGVTWWQYGVPAQIFCLLPQPAVQLLFIHSFMRNCFHTFAPAATACSTGLVC